MSEQALKIQALQDMILEQNLKLASYMLVVSKFIDEQDLQGEFDEFCAAMKMDLGK